MTAARGTQDHNVGQVAVGASAYSGRLRIAFMVFGGMVALQSSPTLDAAKIAYLVGAAVCLAGSLAAVWRVRHTPAVRLRAPWIAASTALAVLVAISLLVARAGGTSITDWTRDAAAYALFATVPVFALDAQASTSRKLLVWMLVVAGLLGGLSWAFEWLSRREILELPLTRLVFPSGQLPGLLYLFAMAMALTSTRRHAVWVVLAGVTLGLFLLTGTRSSLLLLIGPLAMAAFSGWSRIRSSLGILVSHGVVAVAVVIAFQLALALPGVQGPGRTDGEPSSSGPAATSGPNVLSDRIGSLTGLLSNAAADPSIKERVAQYQAAWALFVSSPVVGAGPGHSIAWINVSGRPRTAFTADTPLVMPAKFGLLGILVFLGVAGAYASTVRVAIRRDRRSGITLTLLGYGVMTIVGLPLGFPVEDKGASLSLILLLALAFAERATPRSIDTANVNELNASVSDTQHPDR